MFFICLKIMNIFLTVVKFKKMKLILNLFSTLNIDFSLFINDDFFFLKNVLQNV